MNGKVYYMIELYTGTCGSGKSLHSAKTVLENLALKHNVIVNFPIVLPKKKEKFSQYLHCVNNDELIPEFLISFAQNYWGEKRVREDKIVLIIDECQMLFNCRDWGDKNRRAWLSFFTLHRHYGYKIILVCQYDRMIDRQIRSVVEYQYVHRKVTNFGLYGLIIKVFTFGDVFLSAKVWYPMKENVGVQFFKSRKKYYQLYDTFTLFE